MMSVSFSEQERSNAPVRCNVALVQKAHLGLTVVIGIDLNYSQPGMDRNAVQ